MYIMRVHFFHMKSFYNSITQTNSAGNQLYENNFYTCFSLLWDSQQIIYWMRQFIIHSVAKQEWDRNYLFDASFALPLWRAIKINLSYSANNNNSVSLEFYGQTK